MNAGATPNFARTPAASRICAASAIDLDDAIADDALREILVRRPDAHLLDLRIVRRQMRGRRERVVGLELDHRPRRTPIAASASSSGWNCAQQRRIDAFAGLVAGPEIVAERLDDVIGGDADVRRAFFEHLRDRAQHAGDRAERPVRQLGPRRSP